MSGVPEAIRHDRDAAIRGILVSNALTVLLAILLGDGLIFLLWPYWVQSVVIGYFAQRRIRLLQQFSTDGLKINDESVEPTPETRSRTANFFVLHYGFFHFVYAAFLYGFTTMADASGVVPVRNGETGEMMQFTVGRIDGFEWILLTVAAASFVRTHRESHREHVEADLRGRPNIGTLMFLPYARIVPMHLTILIGAFLGGGRFGILFFGALKTGADVLMHVIEHRMLQRSTPARG